MVSLAARVKTLTSENGLLILMERFEFNPSANLVKLRYAVKNSLDISDILSITDSHGKTLKQTLSVDSYRLILLAMKE